MAPLLNKNTVGFSTQLFPREVASTGSEEDEEGVMKLQRGITKSSKKGGITGRGDDFFGRKKKLGGFLTPVDPLT